MADSPLAIIMVVAGGLACLVAVLDRMTPSGQAVDGAGLIGVILIVAGLLCGMAANIRERLDQVLDELRKGRRGD